MHFKQKAYTGSLAIIMSFAMLCGPFTQIATAQAMGSVVGMVVSDDFSSPIKGAIVKIYNPKTEMFFSSGPTDENGLYTIKDVPIGEYNVVVVTEDGDFPCDLMVNVKSGPPTPLLLALQPSVPFILAPVAGAGVLHWFQKPLGTLLILGTAVGAGYGICEIYCSPCFP